MTDMWVTIFGIHINLNQISCVRYDPQKKITYLVDASPCPYRFRDPNREIYEMICRKIGLAPIKATP